MLCTSWPHHTVSTFSFCYKAQKRSQPEPSNGIDTVDKIVSKLEGRRQHFLKQALPGHHS